LQTKIYSRRLTSIPVCAMCVRATGRFLMSKWSRDLSSHYNMGSIMPHGYVTCHMYWFCHVYMHEFVRNLHRPMHKSCSRQPTVERWFCWQWS